MEKELFDNIINGTHGYTADDYIYPEDSAVRNRLEWFRDQKLALMIHFGLYSQPGICESWPLSDHDSAWSRAQVDWETDGNKFREQYFNLNKSFNPIRFQPDVWADIADKSGFKYLIFTTKHHDGFCLWDTNETDYKATAPECPFSTHKHADIVKSVFNAFREKGLAIAAYFSKPDWHVDSFWAKDQEKYPGEWRMPTYDVGEKPEIWEKFRKFTHSQIMELMSGYGLIDILWFDGGQVSPHIGLDLKMEDIARESREINPELLIVDRTIGGEYENYITPECTVPDEALLVPWESCLTLGTGFSYRYDDAYKSCGEIIKLLIDIVCKGGNLALNIAPSPDGRLPQPAVESVLGMGEWLKKYGEGIYGTRPIAPYKKNGVCYTKKENLIYAFITENDVKPEFCFDGKVTKLSGDDEDIGVYKIYG